MAYLKLNWNLPGANELTESPIAGSVIDIWKQGSYYAHDLKKKQNKKFINLNEEKKYLWVVWSICASLVHILYLAVGCLVMGTGESFDQFKFGVHVLLKDCSLWPTEVIWHHWIRSTLVQVMACHLFWAKPSFEPMLIYHELGPLTYTCVQFNWKMLKKSIWWHDVLKNLKLPPHLSGANELTDCGLVKPYGDLELGKHWLR